ncbi:S1C family serine protease [Chloroflexota bacterium]
MAEWIQWLNENWQHILIAAVVISVVVFVGQWLRRITYDRYHQWASQSSHPGFELFMAKIYGPFIFWFVLLGLFAAVRSSAFSPEVIRTMSLVLLSVFVSSWVWIFYTLSQSITNLYLPKAREYLGKVNAPQPPAGVVINILRALAIIAGTAILLSVWALPDFTGLLVLITVSTIGILALREGSAGLSNRIQLSEDTQNRLRSVAKILLSVAVVIGIFDVIGRIYLAAGKDVVETVDLAVLFLEIGFMIWFITLLRDWNYRRARPSFRLVTAFVICIALILSFVGVQPLTDYKDTAVQYLQTQAARINEFYAAQSSTGNVSELVEMVSPAVVRLEAGDYMGTGMIVDKTGFILTCNHVVEDVQYVRVTLHGGGQYDATVVSRDYEKDLAIIKLNATGISFPTVDLSSASGLKIGEEIIAIGYSLGLEGQTTISKGIVSAFRNETGIGYIQTDAAVNSGSSGGPLLNLKGDTVGVITYKLAGEDIEGMGFAISIDEAKVFIDSVMDSI